MEGQLLDRDILLSGDRKQGLAHEVAWRLARGLHIERLAVGAFLRCGERDDSG